MDACPEQKCTQFLLCQPPVLPSVGWYGFRFLWLFAVQSLQLSLIACVGCCLCRILMSDSLIQLQPLARVGGSLLWLDSGTLTHSVAGAHARFGQSICRLGRLALSTCTWGKREQNRWGLPSYIFSSAGKREERKIESFILAYSCRIYGNMVQNLCICHIRF